MSGAGTMNPSDPSRLLVFVCLVLLAFVRGLVGGGIHPQERDLHPPTEHTRARNNLPGRHT